MRDICLLIMIVLLAFISLAFSSTQVSIQGGPVTIQGQYVDIGKTVVVSTSPITDNSGMCIGILCGVTYN